MKNKKEMAWWMKNKHAMEICRINSSHRLSYFIEIRHKLKDIEYWTILGFLWSMAHWPSESLNDWIYLFSSDRPKRHKLMSLKEQKIFNELPEKVKIYRGHDKDHLDGLSWSLDKNIAEFFAYRYVRRKSDCDFIVTEKTVPKEDIVCYLNDRKENEVIYIENFKIIKARY